MDALGIKRPGDQYVRRAAAPSYLPSADDEEKKSADATQNEQSSRVGRVISNYEYDGQPSSDNDVSNQDEVPFTLSDLKAEIGSANSVDCLNQLRRRCALSWHPDKARGQERQARLVQMQQANTLIDDAIRDLLQAGTNEKP